MQSFSKSHSLWYQLLLLALTLTFFSAAHAAPTLEARVDRNALTVGDSLTLTLRLNDTGDFNPDYRALEKDFALMGESSSSGLTGGSGGFNSWTEWQVTLVPLHSGTFTIPAFEMGGARSKPISIQVKPEGATANANDPVTIETQVDQTSVYVQQQLLLTVRILAAVPLRNGQLNDPEFDNASVHTVGEANSDKTINGIAYKVYERTYAIFPQQAGELTIPEIIFSAMQQHQVQTMFGIQLQGRPLQKMSRQITVHVKPVPPQFSGKVWLPARHLTLQETWGGNPETITAGNSITRSIAIQADGISAAQLPTLETPLFNNARLYADQPTLDDQADAAGMHGKRVENAALIAAREGPLQLPELRVTWWDLDSDSEKVATIAAQTLNILPNGNAAATSAGTAAPASNPADSASTTAIAPHAETGNATAPSFNALFNSANTRVWVIITAGLSMGWLLTLILYWRLRRRVNIHIADVKLPSVETSASSDQLLISAIDCCKKNQASAAHAKFNQWLRSAHPRTPTLSEWLQTLSLNADNAELIAQIKMLDRYIYGDGENIMWDGSNLAAALAALRKVKANNTLENKTLPPLYPTA